MIVRRLCDKVSIHGTYNVYYGGVQEAVAQSEKSSRSDRRGELGMTNEQYKGMLLVQLKI